MMECDIQKNTGILVLVDYQKPFDTLDWKFIHRIFELSNFGLKIQNWLEILQKISRLIITQNGYFSGSISLKGM